MRRTRSTVPVAAGVTLSNNGTIQVISAITNRGTVKNEGLLDVYGGMGGSIQFVDGGRYTGSGTIDVVQAACEDALPGLDLTNFSKEYREGFGGS